jgi:DNA-binding transcriptional LysR family regulator
MELHRLEYFVAVAEEGSFTRAAARVHVAQSGVSAQVRRLEAELGQRLLDRSGRAVRLTDVGAAVLPYARAALDAVAGARLAVDELTGLVRGRVAMGMVLSRPFLDVADLLATFRARHPGVEIGLSEANSDVLLADVQAGRLDVALVGLGAPPPAGIATHRILDEAVIAAVAPDDPLAGRDAIRLDALRERDLISLPKGTGNRTALDAGCARAGFEPRIAFEVSDPQLLGELAARGLGVAIGPESMAAAHADEVHALAITRPRMRARIELAWRADGPTSPAARALIAHARAALAPD